MASGVAQRRGRTATGSAMAVTAEGAPTPAGVRRTHSLAQAGAHFPPGQAHRRGHNPLPGPTTRRSAFNGRPHGRALLLTGGHLRHQATSRPSSPTASQASEASLEFEIQILAPPVVLPVRQDPMLGLAYAVDPPSSPMPRESSRHQEPTSEPDMARQSAQKQSSWPDELVADDHALSAEAADPSVVRAALRTGDGHVEAGFAEDVVHITAGNRSPTPEASATSSSIDGPPPNGPPAGLVDIATAETVVGDGPPSSGPHSIRSPDKVLGHDVAGESTVRPLPIVGPSTVSLPRSPTSSHRSNF